MKPPLLATRITAGSNGSRANSSSAAAGGCPIPPFGFSSRAISAAGCSVSGRSSAACAAQLARARGDRHQGNQGQPGGRASGPARGRFLAQHFQPPCQKRARSMTFGQRLTSAGEKCNVQGESGQPARRRAACRRGRSALLAESRVAASIVGHRFAHFQPKGLVGREQLEARSCSGWFFFSFSRSMAIFCHLIAASQSPTSA